MSDITRKNSINLLEGTVWKQIIRFALPVLLGSLFQQAYNMTDAIIIGQAAGTNALAAVGSTQIVNSLLIGTFTSIASGASVVVSQYFGAGDHPKVEASIHTAYAFSILGALLLMAIGIPITEAFLRMTKVPEEVLPDAVLYLRVFFLGLIGNLVYNIGTGIIRAMGDSKTPLIILIISCILNVFLDLVLVMVLQMGVLGVALATISCQALSAIGVTVILMRAKGSYRLHLKKIRLHLPVLKKIVRIGIPSGMEVVVASATNTVVQTAINGFGTAAMAAWASILRVDGLMYVVHVSYSTSIGTMVGQNFGARKDERVRKIVRTGLLMSVSTISFCALMIDLFCPYIMRLFTQDAEVIRLGCIILYFLATSNILESFISVHGCAIRACGESLKPMLLNVIFVCGLRLVVLLGFVPRVHTLWMVCMNYPVGWFFTAIIFILYYHKGHWYEACVKRLEEKR